ncbi:MAG: hypothetical protein AAF937_06130 [Planctomycetota bacterium]
MNHVQLAVAASLAAAAGLSARGDVLPFLSIAVDPAPIFDAGMDDFVGAPAAVNVGTDPDLDIVTSTANLLRYTTAAGTVSTLAGPIGAANVSTFPTGLGPPAGDTLRNVWGFQGPEIDGIDSILGLNVGAGLDNAGFSGSADVTESFDVFFGVEVVGAPGAGNDFFIMEIIGDDTIDIQALDINGNAIDGATLRIASGPGGDTFNNTDLGDWGDTGLDLALVLENGANIGLPEGAIVDDIDLAGVAFDVEDFGDGSFTGIAGFRITGIDDPMEISSGQGSIDLIALGYNTAAVPAPGVLAILPVAGLALRRRRA